VSSFAAEDPTMQRIALVLFTGFVAAAGIGACFIESPQPSTFRFSCESTDDCLDGEVCADGLCQTPCGGPDDDECPDSSPLCFNGYCANVCPLDQTVCPEPQSCVAFEDPEADEPAMSGFCGIPCDEARPCAEGKLCAEGFCLTPCMSDDECGGGEACLFNVCIPSF
jgi:hypothetical protein